MVRIRLRRVGAKKQASYRVVVADSRAPRDGRFVETIGFYNPRTDPPTVRIQEDRALYWLGQGAQPSDAVKQMLAKGGTLERFARLKAGEALEALVAEFEAGEAGQAEAPVAEEQAQAEIALEPEAPEAEQAAAELEAGREPEAPAAEQAPAEPDLAEEQTPAEEIEES